jgi:hypothetical protein
MRCQCGGVLHAVADLHPQPSGAGWLAATPHYDVVGPWLVMFPQDNTTTGKVSKAGATVWLITLGYMY